MEIETHFDEFEAMLRALYADTDLNESDRLRTLEDWKVRIREVKTNRSERTNQRDDTVIDTELEEILVRSGDHTRVRPAEPRV